MIDKKILYNVFSNIPLDVEGSNISNVAFIPSSLDKIYMTNEDFHNAVKDGNEKNSKVLFKDIYLSFDSCDCGDIYGCSHGSYVYEMRIVGTDKTYELGVDGYNISVYNNDISAMIPMKNVTIYDFYRMCEIVGIELELSDYALSLLVN